MPRNVTVTFADGTQHVYQGVPDDATPAQVEKRAIQESGGKRVTALDGGSGAPSNPTDTPGSPANVAEHQARLAQAQGDLANETSFGKRALDTVKNYGAAQVDALKGGLDTAASLGSQAVATPLAGIAGAVTAPLGFLPGMEGVGARNVERVMNNPVTRFFQPRSDVGKAAAENIANPFTWVAGKADQAGQAVADVTGSPLLGTATSTAIQAVPVLLSKGSRTPFVSAAKAAGRAVTGSAETAAVAGAEAQATAAAAAKAEAYARSIDLDWNGLADSVKGKLTDIVKSSGDLSQLDPEALKRFASLQSLKVPVPATRGTLTRESGELLREDVAKSTPEGAPIAATNVAADNALQANLDALAGKVSGTGKTAATARTSQEAGGAIQGAARAKESVSKSNYQKLYKVARETEPDARAPVTPVTDLLTSNPEIQHLGWVQTWLNRAAKLAGGKDGEPIAITDATLKELADLKSQASAIQKTGGKEGYYAGEVSRAIDSAMEDVPAGAKAWKAANDAFKAHKTEFAEQGAVADLVENSSRTDRAVALENTVKTISNGSLEDIQKIKRTLLTGGDEVTRASGKKAWRELRRKVVENIKQVATKGAQEKADGTPNLSLAKLKQVIDSYGPEKLDEIFGPGNAKEVQRILDAARISKYQPGALGSNTTNKIVAFLSKGLDKIPGGGKIVDVARGIGKLKDLGANARAAEQANLLPLDEALTRAKKLGAKSSLGASAKTVAISSIASGNKQ